jgi:uncharacterized protein DUF4129
VLQAAVQEWGGRAIHDTVAAIVSDRAYRRSVVGSLIGRAIVAIMNAYHRFRDALSRLPGGRITVVVLVVVIIGLIVARVVYSARWRENDLIVRRGRGPRAVRADLWTEAERMAASGDYTGAAHALYQAVLRRLAGTERIRLHASKTSGDYSRELRRRGSPVAAPFQQFGRRFDRVIFGIGECSPEEFSAMLREASAITDRQAA